MAAILSTCPDTGVEVGTGQHATAAEWAKAKTLSGRFRCSSCGRVHDWTKAEVRLANERGAQAVLAE